MRAVALGSIAMSCILAFLLFYNLHAQAPTGLSLTAVGAGVSLLPLSGGLLIFAFAAPNLIRRFGQRHVLAGGNLLMAAAGVVIAVAASAVNIGSMFRNGWDSSIKSADAVPALESA